MTPSETEKPLDGILSAFWDVAVLGSGYCGFGAALKAAECGLKVLLLDPGCGLLWESARARHTLLGEAAPPFGPFVRSVSSVTGILGNWFDPGAPEWVANEILLEKKEITRLFYARPVAVNFGSGGSLLSVTLALRDRLATLRAAKWLDATEDAALLRLSPRPPSPASPAKRISRIFMQHAGWERIGDFAHEEEGFSAKLLPSAWHGEKVLEIESYGEKAPPLLGGYLKAMELFTAALPCEKPLCTHWSYEPYPVYPANREPGATPAIPNAAFAVPALSTGSFETLSSRFSLGVEAMQSLLGMKAAAETPLPHTATLPVPSIELDADVFVAGAGTGGLMAAIAASSMGAKTIALDPERLAGGVSAHGGISAYYFGCPGGLQSRLDKATEKLEPYFSEKGAVTIGYHPLARLIASETMRLESKAELLLDSQVLPESAVVKNGKIESVLAHTPGGIAIVRAKCWIDATGEGFLARMAGVPSEKGRCEDGSLHAYTQSWGAFSYNARGFELFIHNIDCGFADPDDSLDMTWARIHGAHYLVEQSNVRTSNSFNRTTGLMPSVGIREGSLVATRYRLTVDDMVRRKCFADAIGYTGGHVDSHSVDFFMEGKDLAFYNWCALAWREETACQIPYRAILPCGIDNLWLACRAAGATRDAANAFRMQRDMQRTGEAAGIAAALSAQTGCDNGLVPYERLKRRLELSGALAPLSGDDLRYGLGVTSFGGDPGICRDADPIAVKDWAERLKDEKAPFAMWRLHSLDGETLRPVLLPLLGKEGRESFRAALILASKGFEDGNGVLHKAVQSLESVPEGYRVVQPHLSAIWALAYGGSLRSAKILSDLAANEDASPLARLAALWSISMIANRLEFDAEALGKAKTALERTRSVQANLRPWERAFLAEKLRLALSLPRDSEDLAQIANSPWKLVRASLGKITRQNRCDP